MKKAVLSIIILLSAFLSSAQTYCYKYLYNITNDGVKKQGVVATSQFYFTISNDRSVVYLTDKNGFYSLTRGNGEFRYVGRQNGLLTYRSQNDKYDWNFVPVEYLYFSDDFKRMNWDCGMDKFSQRGDLGFRVLEQYDPQKVNAPERLY